jgi:hypothetical protein
LFYSILHIFSLYTVTIPCIAGILVYKHLEANSKMILILLIFASLSQLAPVFLQNKNEIWSFYNLYIIVDVSFWGIIFLKNQKNKAIKTIVGCVLFLHLAISSFFFYNFGIANRFFNELVCFDSLAQVIWVLSYFYGLYKNEEVEKLEYKPMFWFCLGILIYTPSTYFLFVYYNKIKLSAGNDYIYLWRLHDLMNAFMYLIFSVGMWINKMKFNLE